MIKVIFNNPEQDLFKNLSLLGLINFYNKDNNLTYQYKGKTLPELCIKDLSSNACFGDFETQIKNPSENIRNNFINGKWIKAEILLSQEGIDILENSDIKNYTYDK